MKTTDPAPHSTGLGDIRTQAADLAASAHRLGTLAEQADPDQERMLRTTRLLTHARFVELSSRCDEAGRREVAA